MQSQRGRSYSPAFANCSPPVLTMVELKITSSLVFTCGVKLGGVCACAMLAKAATSTGVERYMMSWGDAKRKVIVVSIG
jgi:hypothetical protein